jgi:hypothetical protein
VARGATVEQWTPARTRWKRLGRWLAVDPGRFAGGSAGSDPLGLLAVEHERQVGKTRE